MCGIAGIWRRDRSLRRTELEAMTGRLVHRGPDAEGHVLIDIQSGLRPQTQLEQGGLGLGHRRLSIIDLHERAHQPMASSDGRAWIVYNGEVYNYIELREELKLLGHNFKTETDTEVVLAAYQAWGEACLERFNGMFAFAIWDEHSKRLFCARDRFGIKPFYYCHTAEQFCFASEIKALLTVKGVEASPNPSVIHDYLVYGLADHRDATFFRGIERLPPAHFLVLSAQGDLNLRRWWSPEISDETELQEGSITQAVEEFQLTFIDSVRKRLRSDVRVGTCLSGGLDSSSVVTVANELLYREHALPERLAGTHQQTFTACFEDEPFDERGYANQVIEQTGAQSHRVFPQAQDWWRDLSKVLWHMDEPFQSTSEYSQYCVMRRVKEEGVKVTLDGQGADELMAGYPGYFGVHLAELLRGHNFSLALQEFQAGRRMDPRARSGMALLMRTGFGLLPSGVAARMRAGLAGMLPSVAQEAYAKQFLQPEFLERYRDQRLELNEQRSSDSAALGRRLHADVFTYSLPALLRYEDRNSMAHSVESRTPMLDFRLAELCFRLPSNLKIRDGWSKWMLRQSMQGRLPSEVQWRRDKMGFVTPEQRWLGECKQGILGVFRQLKASEEFLDQGSVMANAEYTLNDPKKRGGTKAVLRSLMLELWMREVVPRSASLS